MRRFRLETQTPEFVQQTREQPVGLPGSESRTYDNRPDPVLMTGPNAENPHVRGKLRELTAQRTMSRKKDQTPSGLGPSLVNTPGRIRRTLAALRAARAFRECKT